MEKIFWITYRIHDDTDYDERYENFIEKIEEVSTAQWKNDTTSFHIIESNFNIDRIASSLSSVLFEHKDHFLIRRMNYQNAVYFGLDSEFENLKKFINYVRKFSS